MLPGVSEVSAPTIRVMHSNPASRSSVAEIHTLIKHMLGTPTDVDRVLLARRHNML
jgi:hypothetical protein